MNKQPAIFLDKDGTLVDNYNYPKEIPKDKLLIEDILEGLKYLKMKGYKLIIVSNQPWIAKGKLTKEETENIFENVITKLKDYNINIDDYIYCPHQRSDNCNCKKPKTELIKNLIDKHNISLNESYVIGDMDSDINLAKNLHIKSILVLTGRGKDFLDYDADFTIKNINEVSKVI